ncbi:UDP-N-acetylmuramate--alanine ligase [bacterium]|nr:UDP-N-acetylmuramate--alanine ligase [bacterium]
MLASILNTRPGRIHFIGIAGSGMYPLARFLALKSNKRITGSDRSFDRDQNIMLKRLLEEAGIEIFPQDGQSLDRKTMLVVISRAVEDTIPEMMAVRRHAIQVVTRAQLLAQISQSMQSIAIAGTSGKTTVTAMCAHVFRQAGMKPNVICGGLIKGFSRDERSDSIVVDDSELLIFEADESDGSLVHYRPLIGTILNITRDHKPLPELMDIFSSFARSCQQAIIYNQGDPRACECVASLGPDIQKVGFGWSRNHDVHPLRHETFGWGSLVTIDNMGIMLKVPGEHNIENALAVLAIARSVGIPLSVIGEGLADFRGVRRRLDRIGTSKGISIIDDFAHNPEKIVASLKTLQEQCTRLIVIFQPHGFGPTLFLKDELINTFSTGLRDQDVLVCLEIYYAGGTVEKTMSSRDLVEAITERGKKAHFHADRPAAMDWLLTQATTGDTIAVMGARDDTLTDFARTILARLEAAP